jgi:hypothetical protein
MSEPPAPKNAARDAAEATLALEGLRMGRVVPRGMLITVGWLLLFLLLSLALLRGMVDGDQVRALVRDARVFPLAGSFVMLFGGLVCMGLRWRALMPEPSQVGRAGMVGICASGQLLNMALPGPVGELVAAALVQRRYRVEAPVALAASIHARFVGVASAALITLVVWLTAPMPVPDSARPFMWGAVVMVSFWGGGLGVLAAWPALFLKPTALVRAWLAPRRQRAVFGATDRVLSLGERFGEALSTMGRQLGRPHLVAAGWNLLGVLSITVSAWVASWALGEPGNIAGILFTQSAVTAGAVVLFAMPGAQVGWDAAFATLLVTTVGLPLEHALAITVLVRLQQLVVVLLGALVLAALLREPSSEGGVPGGAGPGTAG